MTNMQWFAVGLILFQLGWIQHYARGILQELKKQTEAMQ